VPFRAIAPSLHCVAGQAPNGCVAHTKLVSALQECQRVKPILFSAMVDRDISVYSMVMRIVLSKFRTIASDARAANVLRNKATPI
jgi:hypothetical protein